MFLRFNPGKTDISLRRLRQNGVSIEGPETAFEIIESGVELKTYNIDQESGTLESEVVVQVNKHVVQVSINPAIGELLGYQPASAMLLYPGDFGQVVVKTQGIESDDLAALSSLSWLARLHFVPVTTLPD